MVYAILPGLSFLRLYQKRSESQVKLIRAGYTVSGERGPCTNLNGTGAWKKEFFGNQAGLY